MEEGNIPRRQRGRSQQHSIRREDEILEEIPEQDHIEPVPNQRSEPDMEERRLTRYDCIPTRPNNFDKRGLSGTSKAIVSNYFPLTTKRSLSFRLHNVEFSPTKESKILKALLKTRESEIGPYLFDGKMLFTTRILPQELMQLENVYFPNQPDDSHNVKIIFTREVSPLEPIVFQLYNLIIRKCQGLLDLDQLGRHYFDRHVKIPIPNYRLELWPGFITSIRQQENQIMLNVDITHKVVRTENVFEIMKTKRFENPSNYQEPCELAIIGSIVMTRYNRKTYKVDAIDWNQNVTSEFKKKNGKNISYKEYYKERYQENIQCEVQPLLVSRPKIKDIRRGQTSNIFLIPELCFPTGLTPEMRADFRLLKQLAPHLHQEPHERFKALKRFVARLLNSAEVEREMNQWGLRFNPLPLELKGRKMPSEKIMFDDDTENTVDPNEMAEWGSSFRTRRMYLSAVLKNWAIVFTKRDADGIGNLIKTMQNVGDPMGYLISQPVMVQINDSNTLSYVQAIQDAVAACKGKLSMIMIVLANNRLETYAEVKKTLAIDFGIPSQCILNRNVGNRNLFSICTKLVIQMNTKQGGLPWIVKNPLINIMVVGFDTYKSKEAAYGAMVATTSQNLSEHYSTVVKDDGDLNYGLNIGSAFKRCLEAFRGKNGKYPTRIIFYRDGVGEGQLHYVAQTELEDLKNLIKRTYLDDVPKFTYIVVTKRINTRLFLRSGNMDVANPEPGTIVDDIITCPERYDFFMIPQSARQGTVSPIAYNVLFDKSELHPDKIQLFTYKLCHLYFNWSGAISVPAVCQYAHKLAFLTGTILKRPSHPNLSNLLFFL